MKRLRNIKHCQTHTVETRSAWHGNTHYVFSRFTYYATPGFPARTVVTASVHNAHESFIVHRFGI